METYAKERGSQVDSIKGVLYEAGLQSPINVHLVIEQPSEELLASYLDAGADSVAIHWVTLARPMKVDQKTGRNKKNAFSICRHEVIPKETDKNSCLSLFEA